MNQKKQPDDPSLLPASGSSENEQLRLLLQDKIDQLSSTNRQLKRKIFDLYTIFEISRNFNAVLNYESLLDTFIFTCLGQVGALKGAIFLRQDSRSNMFCVAKHKGSGDFPDGQVCFPADSKLADYLTGLNRPVPTEELLSDISTDVEIGILQNFHPGIIVPLIYQTRLTGILAMSEKMSGQEFHIDDLEFLSILSNQIAVAIENSRLYEGERDAIRQLQSAQQQLVQSEKLAALGEMSAKIAHEVNNPLGIITNYMLLLKRSTKDNNDAEEQVQIVTEEIDRIVKIVKQMLKFHRPSGVAFERVDIRKLIDSVLLLWEPQLEAVDIKIEKDCSSAPTPVVMGSAESLRQVLINLIVNARDAMAGRGNLQIKLIQSEDNLVISLSDTGPGIDPDSIPKIFEPFFTTKSEEQGTGLGLSVCYGIIKSHKGSISFKNLETGGCFEITLPLATDD